MIVPKPLPSTLYKFFWDVDPANIDLQLRAKYVINRLLDKGDLEAARWVLQSYPKETIVESLKKGQSIALSKQNVRFCN